MAEISDEELHQELKKLGLEGAGEGVVFPFGYKIIETDDGNKMQPLTPEEYREVYERVKGKPLSDKDLYPRPNCGSTSTRCVSNGCTSAGGRCVRDFDNGFLICSCDY